jgi:hypothetical protein
MTTTRQTAAAASRDMPEYDVGVSSPGGPQSVDILSPNAKPDPFDLSGLLSNPSNPFEG